MLELSFSSKLDWGSYISSVAKTTSKKIATLIRSMKFLSPKVALYLYKSTIRPCMEYCFHVWVHATNSFLELLQKKICRTVGSSLAVCLEPLAQSQNVASLSRFYRCYFGRCLCELVQLVPLLYSWGRSTHCSDWFHDFLLPFLDVTRMSMSTVSFLAQLDSGILWLYNAFLWPMI